MSKSVCEKEVFSEIHKRYANSLRNFLYYKLGDLEKAKDLTQESFLKLWNNCSKVSLDKVKSYLYTIANRIFLDDINHQKVILKFQHRSGISERQMEHNPEYLYRQGEFNVKLEEAVSSLSEKQRVVFLMSRIDKVKNKEIAERLDISIKTVEKHIANALKSLKEKMDELEGLKI